MQTMCEDNSYCSKEDAEEYIKLIDIKLIDFTKEQLVQAAELLDKYIDWIE